MKSVCLALIIVSIFAVSIQTAYGQRVYADDEQNSTSGTASISDPGAAVDIDVTNYSVLSVNIGLLNLFQATQNLQFTGELKPEPTSPLMIRFASGGALLGLLDGTTVQRTNNGSGVGASHNRASLLDLLGLGSDPEPTDVTIPIPGGNQPSDGVRLRISSVLGLTLSANLYYAFFITPPLVEFSTVYVCQGESALISISNFQSGYTYRVYDALTEGALIYSGTTDVLSIPEEDLTTGTYYLEAVEGDTEFTSSRTAFSLEVIPKPGHPDIIGVSDIMN